jgi:hypothetical protein
MKSWVSSAFDEANSTSSRTTRRDTAKKAAIDLPPPAPLLSKENSTKRYTASQPVSTMSRRPAQKDDHTGMSLCDKYEPTNRADLVVNSKKVEQLSSMLDDLIKKQKGSILVIEGPSGSGKNVNYFNN